MAFLKPVWIQRNHLVNLFVLFIRITGLMKHRVNTLQRDTHMHFDFTTPKGPGKRGHIVADTNVSPFAPARNICCGTKFCVQDTKNVSDFVQKHFVSAINVSQFARPKTHHGQQCVRNNVSSFTRALKTLKSLQTLLLSILQTIKA